VLWIRRKLGGNKKCKVKERVGEKEAVAEEEGKTRLCLVCILFLVDVVQVFIWGRPSNSVGGCREEKK
jgi:hypothetical protein